MTYTSRLQQLIAASGSALKALERERDSLVESHTPMTLRPKLENIPEPEVRAQVRKMDRTIQRLRTALGHYAEPAPTKRGKAS